MAISKITLNGVTQMDITDTTAEAADVANTKYFYTNAGVKTQGSASGGGVDYEAYYVSLVNRSISSLVFPSGLTTIGTYAFYACHNLTSITIPNTITSIGMYAFSSCQSATTLSFENNSVLTSVGGYSFYSMPSLGGSIVLPSTVSTIGNYAFARTPNITSIRCDGVLTSFQSSCVGGSTGHEMLLEEAYFPHMGDSGTKFQIGQGFGNTTAASACRHVEIVDFGIGAYQLNANAFANCYSLRTLVLRIASAVCTIDATTFTNTPLDGYNGLTGTVYVPNALISTYQTATNWSTLYNNGTVSFVKIEGSIYEL